MHVLKFIGKIVLALIFAFGLTAGGIAMAGPLGTKDELSFEFNPAGGEGGTAEKKPVAQAPEKTTQEKEPAESTQAIQVKEASPQKPDAQAQVSAKEGEGIAAQQIKAHPIKVEDKVTEPAKEPEEKKAEPVKRAETKKPSDKKQKAAKAHKAEKPAPIKKAEPAKSLEVKKEVIKLPETSQVTQPSGKEVGVLNRWFGLETGVESMKMRRRSGTQIISGSGPDGIFSLDDCINIAIKNNIPIQISEKNVKLAKMRVMEARRNMLPSATLVWEPYTGVVNEQRYYGRKQYIEGKQPIFHGGELFFTLKQAEVNLEISRNEANKTKNELVLQVRKAYYSLAKADDNLKLQSELIAEAEHIFKMVNEQYDAKIASKLELLNVSSQLSQIKYQLASADGDVGVAELILKQAMNVDPEVIVKIRPKLEFNKVEVKYEDALKAAFANRPEVIINTLMIDYYLYGEKVAASKGLPKVDIMGSWGLAKETYLPEDNAFNSTGWGNLPGTNTPIIADEKLKAQWYAGVKASLPAWGSTGEYSFTREQWVPTVATFQGTEAKTNSFKLKILDNLAMYSDKQLSEIDFDRARQELNKTKQDVNLEVKEECFNYQKALIQLDTAEYKVKYQENELEFTRMKRSIDEAEDSNVIESMIKLSQEKFGYVQALTDCHTAIASINKAIGVKDYIKDE